MTPQLVDHAHVDSCAAIGCNLVQLRRKKNMFISGRSHIAVASQSQSQLWILQRLSECFSMAPHIRNHRAPCSCFPKKTSLQLSSEQSVGDVWITQLDWRRVPKARSRGWKSSIAITTECLRHHASRNVSWPPTVVGLVERRLPGQREQACGGGSNLKVGGTWRARSASL